MYLTYFLLHYLLCLKVDFKKHELIAIILELIAILVVFLFRYLRRSNLATFAVTEGLLVRFAPFGVLFYVMPFAMS